MTATLIKREHLDTDTYGTEGRPCEDRGTRRPSTDQGQGQGIDPRSQTSEGTNSVHTLILDLGFRTVKKYISVV